MKTTQVVRELAQSTVTALGYELVDVEFKKEQADWVLMLFIDKPEGITLDDCERVSRAVEPILDEADPIAQSYFLSVSSPGLDRPLKTERDYERNIGKPVTLKLYSKLYDKKEFTGTLLGVEDEAVRLLLKGGEELAFALKDVAQAKPYIDFS